MYDTDDENIRKFDLNRIFAEKTENSFKFEISKEQAAGLLGLLNHINDLREDFKIEPGNSNTPGICLNVNTMEFTDKKTACELQDNTDERIIAFNVKYLEEALKFIMCSDNSSIEVYYNGSHEAFVMKSSCLYVLVLPVRLNAE